MNNTRNQYTKRHKGAMILWIALSILLLAGYFDQTAKATEQVKRIDSLQSDQRIPFDSHYSYAHASFILPYTKETNGRVKEQNPEQIGETGGSVKCVQAHFSFYTLFFLLLVLTAFYLSQISLSTTLSVRQSHSTIISYIHDQDGQK